MSFSERLKIIIEEDYKTQSNFAEAIRVTKASVNDYISSKRKPNFDVLKKIADLGYNMNWLLTGEGSIKKEFLNLEILDHYDKSIVETYSSVVGKGNFNPVIMENKKLYEEISSYQKSEHVLTFLYRFGIVKTLKHQLTFTKSFEELEMALNYPHIKEIHIYRDILPAIDLFLAEGKISKKLDLHENAFIELVIRNISKLYVIYAEIVDLEKRLDNNWFVSDFKDIKSIYTHIYDSMNNELYLHLKSERFIKSVTLTFDYKEEDFYKNN